MNILIKAVLAVLFSAVFPCAISSAAVDSEDSNALTAVTHDLCHRQVAMLGESATHGDGHAVAFKVALVQRLVSECGFDSVFFEASHYEFIHVAEQLRIGHAVSVDQVSSAIGGLWKFDREFQPLVPFLLAKAQAGKISLGGIDDQLGQLGQDYANLEMINELATSLSQEERQTCILALHRRINSDYTEAAPYSKSDRSQIADCLRNMERSVAADRTINLSAREEREEIISTVQRWISRDFTSDEASVVERDRSMFQNFKWLRRRQPNRHKVILWAATVHIAKRGDPSWADHTGINFGTYVHQEYGAQAFSLGFSALTGSYRQGRDTHELPTAPIDSLEAQTLRGSDTAYLGPSQLASKGALPGAIFRHSYQTLTWSDFLDGVVIFPVERPPRSSR